VNRRFLFGLIAVFALVAVAPAQLKDEMRMPWTRGSERFLRDWLMVGDFPGGMDQDWLGGEAAARPKADQTVSLPDGSKATWRSVKSWGDSNDLSDGKGLKRDVVGYAFATINRKEAGKALLAVGSDESVRVWLNGALVLDRRTGRQLTLDEDQVPVDLKAGENALLVKLEQRIGPWVFSARVVEPGTVLARVQEIGPSIDYSQPGIVVKTDIGKERAALDRVKVEVVGAGGKVFASETAARGATVRFNPATWPDGAYEVRSETHAVNGLLYSTHLPWYKGDAIAAAGRLVAAAEKANQQTPEGFTIKMLADMVLDRLGKDGLKVTGNPWWAVHSPLMEFEEMQLEAQGKTAIVRPYGFLRLAYRDEVDGSPQFCRLYLPPGYDPAKKWPLLVKLHGYNPANPDYVRWWAVDSRHHALADIEYSHHQGIIYMEPHGRGNTTYLGLGDRDVVRAIELAKKRLSIDDDRVYLSGDSMGGWGTWNVAERHPELFAAIAPIFGGVDYHSYSTEAELGKMHALDRFLADRGSSWSMGEALLHLPIFVHHGDVDRSVNVDYSRYGVRMLQRWGYDVRYREMPGYGHEDLNVMGDVIEWLLEHRRDAAPRTASLRSAELQNASAYWVQVDQAQSPKEFMVVNAEVMDPNVIRVDSENVVALTLAPGALIDPAKDVKVVWNGDPRVVKARNGRIVLRAAGYTPAAFEKSAQIAGPLGDVLNTPFAIVTGTASADPAMKEMCKAKAEALVQMWKAWQRQPPRVYLDSELSDADAARYSLILIGGPDANLVARKLAVKLPVEVAVDHIKIGGRSFAATGARVQMIYPNPLNAGRYVYLVAGTSASGLYFWMPEALRNAQFDFSIEDGHMPSAKERQTQREVWVAGGWFDREWKVSDALLIPGDEAARSKSVLLDPPREIDPKVLESYVGTYQVMQSITVKIRKNGNMLIAQVADQPPADLIPLNDTDFYIIDGAVEVTFVKDASGKVTSLKGMQNGRPFTGKKTE
jgi:enterochelin esterase-like enzyme